MNELNSLELELVAAGGERKVTVANTGLAGQAQGQRQGQGQGQGQAQRQRGR